MDKTGILFEAKRVAAGAETLTEVGRRVAESLGITLSDAASRGLLQRNVADRSEILAAMHRSGDGRTLSIWGDQRIAVVNDAHSPFHDKGAIESAARVIEDFRPTLLVLNGDMVDFYALSRFDKDPTRVLDLQGELDAAKVGVLRPLIRSAPGARVVYVMGNHEERLVRYVHAHPELSSLRALTLDSLLDFGALGIELVDHGVEVNGSVLITHGRTVRKWSGRSVQGELEKVRFGLSVVMGHVHRVGRTIIATRFGPVFGIESGCLCGLRPEYDPNPDWSHGLALVESTKDRTEGREVLLYAK